jgi:1,2-phenylacetyl-CoA epoxidase PaaB subunit
MSSQTTNPFQNRPELALKRRDSSSASRPPMAVEGSEHSDGTENEPRGHTALEAAWDKLYRARSLLEAEQVHLRDDRIALQGVLEDIIRREEAVSLREQRIQHIEAERALDKEEAAEAATEKEERSAISKLTQAPFDIARSVFGAKK